MTDRGDLHITTPWESSGILGNVLQQQNKITKKYDIHLHEVNIEMFFKTLTTTINLHNLPIKADHLSCKINHNFMICLRRVQRKF